MDKQNPFDPAEFLRQMQQGEMDGRLNEHLSQLSLEQMKQLVDFLKEQNKLR